MANTIQIKRGSTAPTSANLSVGELGYCTTGTSSGLYIGATNSKVVQLTASPTTISVTLTSNSFTNGVANITFAAYPTNRVLNVGLNTTSIDSASYKEIAKAMLVPSAYTTAGSLAIKALGSLPSVSIPIIITVI